jgi:catalase
VTLGRAACARTGSHGAHLRCRAVATDDLSERLVASLNDTYGVHPGHRAAHAKGVLCAGTFEPSLGAARLSRAAHFSSPVRVHVRFSNGSGDPGAPDAARDARGIGAKFYLPDGTTTDVVGLSLPAFFARNPEDLLAFNDARRPDPSTGQPDLAKVGAYLAAHPEAMTAITAAVTHPIPASYAALTYHSLHAYGFAAAAGTVRYGRYHFVPDEHGAAVTEEDVGDRSPDYLREELAERLSKGTAVFHLRVELAGDGDPVDDPTAVWPEGRDMVEVGRLEITALAFDRDRDGDVLVFDPTRVTDGISLTDDPILLARPGAYSVSIARRTAAPS